MNRSNFAQGKTKSLKLDAGDYQTGSSVKDIQVVYKINSAGITATCSKKFDVSIEDGQITRVSLPDGAVIQKGGLLDWTDQIVRVGIRISGSVTARTCKYRGQHVYKR